MANFVEEFFQPYERRVNSFEDASDTIDTIYRKWIKKSRRFAWRGAANADWSLHSSLYRHALKIRQGKPPPTEKEVREYEREILREAHRWGLHHGTRGRMSVLAQLATLQHFGAPTRLIDVSLNAYIALWFAVEKEDHVDGRLFAIDITDRLINESAEYHTWEDELEAPWSAGTSLVPTDKWTRSTWAWVPAPFETRMSRQHGAFLFSGVPQTGQRLQWPREGAPGRWLIGEVRSCTSLAIRFHKVERRRGALPEQPAFTVRISSAAKQEIRHRLDAIFGYNHRSLFPDYPGFADFGTAGIRAPRPS